MPGSCSDAPEPQDGGAPRTILSYTYEILQPWLPQMGDSTEEANGTAVVFFTKGLSSQWPAFLTLHLALFLGVAGSWVRLPFNITALGVWSCAFVASGHLALVHRLSCRVVRNTESSLCHGGNNSPNKYVFAFFGSNFKNRCSVLPLISWGLYNAFNIQLQEIHLLVVRETYLLVWRFFSFGRYNAHTNFN